MQLPQGFRYAGVTCGLKQSGAADLSLIASDSPCVAAGVYTQNLVCAAPVELDRERTPLSDCAGVVVNSGNANACTGAQGMADALQMTAWAAEAIGADPAKLLVMSTGIIGQHLEMAKIQNGIRAAGQQLAAGPKAFEDAARGMLTTDQGIKVGSRQADGAALAGMAKGAGMIGPRMATLLGVVLTDAQLKPDDALAALRAAVDVSFNCIRVDGHTSTSDTVLLLASGRAGQVDAGRFQEQLTELCIELAKQVPADGEGASHLIEVRVDGCQTSEQARRIAEAVADSPLVKTAVTGNDPNWGRICSAAGYAGVAFDIGRLSLRLNGFDLFRDGEPLEYDAAACSRAMRDSDVVEMHVTVGDGPGAARVWASDLTVDYVRFNSEYTT